ncbi:MAG: hypothetical protein GEU97_15825 [Actinophytocola sp.]|nr:hypothetical protein [Actinophytocola sp.]
MTDADHEDLTPVPRRELPPPTPEEANRVMNPTRLDRVLSWLGWWALELTGALVAAVAATMWPPLLLVTAALLIWIALDPWRQRRRFERQRRRVQARSAAAADAEHGGSASAEDAETAAESPTDNDREAAG